MYFSFVILLLQLNSLYSEKVLTPIEERRPSSKYDNPNFIRDRLRDEIWKPMMNESWVNRFKRPFHPAWMDYCDPYHCNDYHKIACGLNRKNMRFKWFQSACHVILNNMCSRYRGSLKYDLIEPKHCSKYMMFLRKGCPSDCHSVLDPICVVSIVDNHVALFQNYCFLKRANCRGGILEEYEEVDMGICSLAINYKKK